MTIQTQHILIKNTSIHVLMNKSIDFEHGLSISNMLMSEETKSIANTETN
jgi:hypothetical protein